MRIHKDTGAVKNNLQLLDKGAVQTSTWLNKYTCGMYLYLGQHQISIDQDELEELHAKIEALLQAQRDHAHDQFGDK